MTVFYGVNGFPGNVPVVRQTPGAPGPQGQPAREYLGGGWRSPLRGGYATVASEALDAERCFGPDLWEVMMMSPFVGASVRLMISAILSHGLQCTPNISPDADNETESRKKRSAEVAEMVRRATQRMRGGLVRPIRQVLRSAVVHGTGLGEQVYGDITSGPDKGKLGLARLKPKPIRSWWIVTDPHDNVIGIGGDMVDERGMPLSGKTLPAEKFCIFPWDQQDGCPAGRSALREAEPAWNMLVQSYPLEWAYMELFSNPIIWGECGESMRDEPELDEEGHPDPSGAVIPPIEQMSRALADARGGDWLALATGSKVGLLSPSGNGEVFGTIMGQLEREVVYSILGSARVTLEAENSSRKDGETAQDILGTASMAGKSLLADVVQDQIYRPLVAYNFGEADAEEFCPACNAGQTEHQDFSRNGNAVANLWKVGVLREMDRPMVFRFLGFNDAADPSKPNPTTVVMPGQPGAPPPGAGGPPSPKPAPNAA